MPETVKPDALDQMSESVALATILARFRWTRPFEKFLSGCLDWQRSYNPRPNFYYRWHLPRLVATIELLKSLPEGFSPHSVMDIACYPPYSHHLETYLLGRFHDTAWTRTSHLGGVEKYSSDNRGIEIQLQAIELNQAPIPIADASCDLVVFTEVVEHLNVHPQLILGELNRITRHGGCLLISTPNVASWKKLKLLMSGNWDYDSPTFSGSWGHRFEYSPYQLRTMLRATGFQVVRSIYRDVYFDDPHGICELLRFLTAASATAASVSPRSALRLLLRAGSGMFLLCQKANEASRTPESEWLQI